jgi:hypothetical protein
VPGSCLWHVIGLEWPVARWAVEKFGRDRSEARGVLIATLAMLDAHHSGRRPAA